MPERIELFIGCRALVCESRKDINSFVVVYARRDEETDFVESARSETVCCTASPQYCTSFVVDKDHSLILLVEVYNRIKEGTERLSDQEQLGKATIPLQSLLSLPHFTTHISHARKSQKVGVLSLHAEEIEVNNTENETLIEFDLQAAMLRKRDWNKSVLTQRYELLRAHRHDDADGQIVWLPLYRSDRMGKQRTSSALHVEFTRASFTHRHLVNGDDERRLRVLLTSGNTSTKRESGVEIGYAEFTLRDMCEVNPTEEDFQIERDGVDTDELGTISILRAEPTDYGSHFSLQVNHESTERYTSAAAEKIGHRKMRKPRSFVRPISSGKDKARVLAGVRSPSALFTSTF